MIGKICFHKTKVWHPAHESAKGTDSGARLPLLAGLTYTRWHGAFDHKKIGIAVICNDNMMFTNE